MIYRTKQEEVDKYYQRLEVNQSSLKEILSYGMESFLAKAPELMSEYSEKKHFIVGSAVDCKLTMAEEDFNKQYHVSTIPKKPGEKVMIILKTAYQEAYNIGSGVDIDMSGYVNQIYAACNQTEYYMNRYKAGVEPKDDTRVIGIIKDTLAKDYWADIISAEGKQVLSDGELIIINSVVDSFKNASHTASLLQDGEDRDLVFQFITYFTLNGIECKAMLDEVLINHKKKIVTPLDYKTLGDYVSRFPIHVNTRRYDLQAAFYSSALRLSLNTLGNLIGKNISDYSVGRFAFAAESTTNPGFPLIFPIQDDLIVRGKVGDDDYDGYEKALENYKIWQKVGFKREEVLGANKGIIYLDQTNVGTVINNLF